METRKLYYEDCHLSHFTARVLRCHDTQKGWEVLLDATAFYPEGGGQACDLGTLGGVRVLDVREQDGEILHLCSGPLSIGEAVEGQINEARRFDLMQQHSGEHIVSGIIHRRYGYNNVGFHIGSEVMTIDFDGLIPVDALEEIELRANRAVWKNLPLRCWYPSPEELPSIQYRTKRILPWPVRIVEIPGVDRCACCGVHVAATGEIGLIKLLSCVKFHQGVRIELVCGRRALTHICQVYEQNRQVSQAFSTKLLETGAAAKRMNEQLSAEKFRCVGLERRIFTAIAAGSAGKGDVLCFEPGLNSTGVRELADKIADVCGGTAAVFSGESGAYCVCLISRNKDVRSLGAEMAKALNGRGGGKPEAYQGSVRASKEEVQAFFKALRFFVS